MATSLFAAGLISSPAHSQNLGISHLGTTGGLQIPSAYVLPRGKAAFSLGNSQDAGLGEYQHKRNYTGGFGLGNGFEVFGRLADYQNPHDPSYTSHGLRINGPRDISANVKWQLPWEFDSLPKLAVGMTDISGGATHFRSTYAVASDDLGPLRWSLGYAKFQKKNDASRQARSLDGVFGGAELKLWDTQASALIEIDGNTRYAGLRYYSDPFPWLGDARVVGSVQRSFGTNNHLGKSADATAFNLSLIVPLDTSDTQRIQKAKKTSAALPDLQATTDAAQLPDPLPALQSLLRSAGLDRVRVGQLGTDIVVEYEDHRYLHNDVDALGIVLGLAAEYAPANAQNIRAVSLKNGLPVMTASVNVQSFRQYLRSDDLSAAQASMGFNALTSAESEQVEWVQAGVSPKARLRVALKPVLAYTVGTEFGVFDYSLALKVRTAAPLWKGAEVYADWLQRIDNSRSMEPGEVFASSRHRNGLQTVAIQQSFWLTPKWFTSIGAGRYEFNQWGTEGESIVFLPWNQDSLHVRGSFTRRNEADTARWGRRTVDAASVLYRAHIDSVTWAEAGVHRFTDGSNGPTLGVTRWFGDSNVQLYARKGGSNSFVGIEFSFPLSPRQGAKAAPVQLTGTPRFSLGLRTLLTNGGNQGNYVRPNAVRPVNLNYQPEIEQLNSGRQDPAYLRSQLPRMKESFYLYGRGLMQ